MGLFERRLTHDQWSKDLTERPDRTMTLAEFRAAEAASTHALLEAIHCRLGELNAALGIRPEAPGGYFEQIRNLLDRFVRHVTVPRPPAARPAVGEAAAGGQAQLHLVPPPAGEHGPNGQRGG